MYQAVMGAPFGKIGIRTHLEQLTGIEFLAANISEQTAADAFTREVIKQLKAYLKNSDFQFDLPIKLDVTPFQEQVLRALRKIKKGNPLSYGTLAEKLDSHPRAIGAACRRNPIAIVIPCHRVIGQKSISGFNGQTKGTMIHIKEWLLDHEQPSN